jgi:hypothetical protein
MSYQKAYVDNPLCKGHKIEHRDFTRGDEDFENICKAVPLTKEFMGEDSKARAWWQQGFGGVLLLAVGVPTKTPAQRMFNPPMGSDRKYYPGDEAGTLIEGRTFAAIEHKGKALQFCPPGHVPGFVCAAWWEVADVENPGKGKATLCIGLRKLKGAEAVTIAGDGLEALTKKKLLALAVTEGLRGIDNTALEGTIIQAIREHRLSKKTKLPQGELAAV